MALVLLAKYPWLRISTSPKMSDMDFQEQCSEEKERKGNKKTVKLTQYVEHEYTITQKITTLKEKSSKQNIKPTLKALWVKVSPDYLCTLEAQGKIESECRELKCCSDQVIEGYFLPKRWKGQLQQPSFFNNCPHTRVHMHTHAHPHTCTQPSACTHMHNHTHKHSNTHTRSHILCIFVHTYSFTSMPTHPYLYIHTNSVRIHT